MNAPYGYTEYLPPGYDAAENKNRKWPLILMLHGVGEKGDGNLTLSKATVNGPNSRIRAGRHFPAVIITPQLLSSTSGWSPSTVNSFVDYLLEVYRIDPSRFYLTGLSLGGLGTEDYLRVYHSRVAAVVVAAGDYAARTDAEHVAFHSTPAYEVHNIDDNLIPYTSSLGLAYSIGNYISALNGAADAYNSTGLDTTSILNESTKTWEFDYVARQLRDSKGKLRSKAHTIFSFPLKGGHDSWTKTYEAEDTWNWLFCQKKEQ